MSYLRKIAATIATSISRDTETIVFRAMASYSQKLDDLMILQGKALALRNADHSPLPCIQDAEFKVFSQFGEDGILQHLIRETGITRAESTFVEFGVENYSEANTRFLMMNDHWRGLVIDGSKDYIDQVRNQDLYWRHDLTAVVAWIDRENINQIIGDSGFSGETGILSIDIDGNDYWVWERIDVIRPIIVVVEWNSVFGRMHAISIPYDPSFSREKAHYSFLFWGASIAAMEHLGACKGYTLLGSNSVGNNLFFVRNDRLGRLERRSAAQAHVDSRFRDSRNAQGKMNFLSGDKRRQEILDLPVVNVLSGSVTTLRTLDAVAK